MKFVSKSANLFVVLKPGIEGNRLVGQPAQPAVSVRFRDGMAEVKDSELKELMLTHPAFNVDFIAIEDEDKDPYAHQRKESEPGHSITELQHGTPVATRNSKVKTQLPPETMAAVKDLAKEMALEMLKEMAKDKQTLQSEENAAVEAEDSKEEENIDSSEKKNDDESVKEAPKKTASKGTKKSTSK